MYDDEFYLSLENVGPIQFLKNLNYYRKLNNKLDLEVGDFLTKNTNAPKLYGNDLRHQYVSALYARNLGDEWAKKLGDWNELLDMSGSGREDTQIDKINNEIGRNYAKKYPTLPRNQLLQKLLDDNYQNQQYRKNKMQ